MDSFDFGSLNYLAIIVAVIFNQALGAAWYSILAKPWMAEVGLTLEDLSAMKGTPRQWYPYVLAVGLGLVFTIGLALILHETGVDSAGGGLALGLLAALAFVFTSMGVTYAFEGRSLRLFIINSCYPLISYSVIGMLLAVWT